MTAFHTVETFGPHQAATHEGFLVVRNVPLARTGPQLYSDKEVPVKGDSQGRVIVMRDEDEVFRPETIASLQGKPITLDHPDEDVTPENWRDLAVGHVVNPRRGQGQFDNLLLGDLFVTCPKAIAAIRDGSLRELSVGYDASYEDTGFGKGRQTNIIANHLALVDNGRCGPLCRIGDRATIPHGCGRDACTCATRDAFEESKHQRGEGGKFAAGSGNGEIVDKHGKKYRVEHHIDYSGRHEYNVHDPENPDNGYGGHVASATLRKDKPAISSMLTRGKYQRRGIATSLYNHIEKHQGIKLDPNAALTEEGAAFWKARQARSRDAIVPDDEDAAFRRLEAALDADDTKQLKSAVDYGPASDDDRCGICSHYDAGSCELVEGEIDPDAWCKLFASPTNDDATRTTDPPVSEKQRRAMFAALHGKSTLGIPKSVAEKFVGKGHDTAHDPDTGQFTASSHSVGEVAEHHGYQKKASKSYSLAKAGKNWSAKAGHRTTETYQHPKTGHSITVKSPNWKHNFAKSGGNSRSGVGPVELHEHLESRKSRDSAVPRHRPHIHVHV